MAVRHSHDTDNAVEAPDLKLADVVDTIKRYCSQEDPSDSGAALGDRLIELRHAIDVMEVRFSETAAAFAGTDQYDRDGSASPIDWIRHRCRMSGHAAADRVRVGKQLRRLAESAEAVSAGQIGFAHLSLLASTARALTTSPTALEPFDEAALLTAARDSSVGRFRHVCYHVRHGADANCFADQASAHEARRLQLINCEDGSVALRGCLDPAGGALLRSVLEPLARRSDPGDDRHRNRRLADALMHVTHHALDVRGVPRPASQHVHLNVTASPESLLGADSAVTDVRRSRRLVPASRRTIKVSDKHRQRPARGTLTVLFNWSRPTTAA